MTARAIANNDMVYLQWTYPIKIQNCLGFSVHRINLKTNTERPLPTWVGFEATPNIHHERRTSDVWPIQKFQWKDVTARRGGHYTYRVIPMLGTPAALTPADDQAQETNEVRLAPTHGSISAYFNRGIISTQAIAELLPKKPDGAPDDEALRRLITQPDGEVRERLAGDLDEALPSLLERARNEGGECFCALYELSDSQMIDALLQTERVHIVLSKAGDGDGTNRDARQRLHDANKDIADRMLGDNHVGHNKFVVYVDAQGTPRAVLAGSTNWTSTGLCSQTNNLIIVDSESLARQYLAYWHALRAEGAAQSAAFRTSNRTKLPAVDLGTGQGSIQAWFSPNTVQLNKPSKNPATPVDLQEVFVLMASAEKGVLFLAFIPGRPSIVTELRRLYNEKVQQGQRLFVRGAATDPGAVDEFKVDLFHRTMRSDASVTSVAGIDDAFSYWQRELYKLGHAVIHDKIVVVDPFTGNCAVITGSHNLGFKASYANDENLLIIRGNREVAAAYAAHVLDVYDHFRWRYQLQKAALGGHPNIAWQDLDETDSWQDKYFDPRRLASADVLFWS
jgi:hypothetical protein